MAVVVDLQVVYNLRKAIVLEENAHECQVRDIRICPAAGSA